MIKRLGALSTPPSASGGLSFRGSIDSLSLQPGHWLASRADRTSAPRWASRDFYFRAFDNSVSLLVAEYDYGANWAIYTDGTSLPGHPLDKQLASLH